MSLKWKRNMVANYLIWLHTGLPGPPTKSSTTQSIATTKMTIRPFILVRITSPILMFSRLKENYATWLHVRAISIDCLSYINKDFDWFFILSNRCTYHKKYLVIYQIHLIVLFSFHLNVIHILYIHKNLLIIFVYEIWKNTITFRCFNQYFIFACPHVPLATPLSNNQRIVLRQNQKILTSLKNI